MSRRIFLHASTCRRPALRGRQKEKAILMGHFCALYGHHTGIRIPEFELSQVFAIPIDTVHFVLRHHIMNGLINLLAVGGIMPETLKKYRLLISEVSMEILRTVLSLGHMDASGRVKPR